MEHARNTRRQALVDVSWLNSALVASKNLVVLEVRFEIEDEDDPERAARHDLMRSCDDEKEGGARSTSCIPGAISVHPSFFETADKSKYYPRYETPEDGNLRPDAELHKAVAELGITKDSCVVVYGRGFIAPMVACRVAWALMYAGVDDVRLLDGGFAAWEHGGLPLAPHPLPPQPVDGNADFSCVQEFLASTEEVSSISKGNGASGLLVDIRKQGEFDGTFQDTYNFFSKAGHVPSACFHGNWDTLIMQDGTTRFKNLDSIYAMWKSLGLLKNGGGGLIFYCGTGWRSSIGFFLAYLLGLQSPKNYDSGWYGWSAQTDTDDSS